MGSLRKGSGSRRAVFADRDGTLNKLFRYLFRMEDFEWIPGVPQAIRLLNDHDIQVIVVTNQAGVAHGIFTEEDVTRLHHHMQRSLDEQTGAVIDAFYYCPHHPEGIDPRYRRDSNDRKPNSGMFERAVQERAINPSLSFVVGDRNNDLEAGRRLGITTLLVETGYGIEERAATMADHVVEDFGAAVDEILRLV